MLIGSRCPLISHCRWGIWRTNRCLGRIPVRALGKFPSVSDERCVTRAGLLALHLAQRSGIDAAKARIAMVVDTPVAVISRFDRTREHARIAYLSAASMLQASRHEDHAYTEVVDAMRARCADPVADARQFWRRLVFNHLITNVDDLLQNLGFLYAGSGRATVCT